MFSLSALLPLLIIISACVCLITLVRTDLGLIILIFSMLLSPELKLAQLSPDRAVVIRIDDILLAVVFFTWLAKVAVKKEVGLLRPTPLNLPIMLYIAACILFSAKGIIIGEVKLKDSFFYLLKYSEYFMLYFMFSNNIHSQKQINIFITAFLITGLVICIYTSGQIGRLARTTAPFEGPQAEPNSLAGYLLLLFALCASLFLYNTSPIKGIILGSLACLAIPPFLFSLSRGGYSGFICLYLTLMILSRKKRTLLFLLFALGILLGPLILPDKVIERITSTFIPGKEYQLFGGRLALDYSAAARVESWANILNKWQKRPFFGYGVTGVGLVDSQYARVIGELGAVGFLIFTWLLVTIFRNAFQIFKSTQSDYFKGISLGFLAGFVGLLVQGLTGNVFIIVRIMEPFWFLAAVVMALPYLSLPQEEVEIPPAK